MSLLLNISNHSSDQWSEDQKKGWDAIRDIPFPNVDPHATESEVDSMVLGLFVSIVKDLYADYRKKKPGWTCLHPEKDRVIIKKLFANVTFHVAGEWSFFYAFVSLIKWHGGRCVVACSSRRVIETVRDGQTHKQVVFEFVRWRQL